MPQPMLPAQSAGAPSPPQAPPQNPTDHFADFLNRNNYIPLWTHPDVARSMVRHFGKTGEVIVHPHPSTGYAAGGVASAGPVPPQPQPRLMARPLVGPQRGVVGGAPQAGGAGAGGAAASPLAGIRQASRSIFTGGDVGAAGPVQRPPILAKTGRIMDGTDGAGRVPGREVPASQKEGHDSVHAMLDPGELVANKKQLRGLQVKPGKAHLLRDDQKKALKQAHKRDASRK